MKLSRKEQNILKAVQNDLEVFNYDFMQLKKQPNFISFDKLMSTIQLKAQTKSKDIDVKKLFNYLKQAQNKKYEIILDEFVLSYKLDERLNNYYLVPFIKQFPSTNIESINLRTETNLFKSKIALYFNEEIKQLLNKNFFVEIIENIIVKTDNESNLLNIFYNEKSIIGW
ncbi:MULTISPECIES: MSC_0623 family F1-like ATPase-associated protein [unclassified Mycoplasma]|uniref:MSC_0623 family F1-like ATPase-associated protein n=1 Tax=Mycoplasma sp. 125 TaxID=3447505 RepID=UPI003F65BBCB